MNWSRRRVLAAGACLAGASAAGVLARPARAQEERRRRSGSRSRICTRPNRSTWNSFAAAATLPEALAAIQVLLRDFRNGEQHPIDPTLLDYLHDVAHDNRRRPGVQRDFGLSLAADQRALRERSSGVARHSLHLEGRAIDVRLAGVDCADLAGHALGLTRGGVGYYRQSDFVHLDTGAFRTWRG